MTVAELREILYELDGDLPVFAAGTNGALFVPGRVHEDLVPDPEFPELPDNTVAAVVMYEEWDAS
jgi:hypothetical protein